MVTPYSEKDFWRGVFDGNGSIGFTKQNEPFISFVITSENLKNLLCKLLSEKFNIYKNVHPNKRDKIYNIVLKNEDAISFANFMYENNNIHLKRKYDKYKQFSQWKRTKKRIRQKSWTIDDINFIKTHDIKESMIVLNRTEKSIKMKLWKLRQSNNF